MGQRIIEGAYTYEFVILKREDLKPGIDVYLNEKGYSHLIVEQE